MKSWPVIGKAGLTLQGHCQFKLLVNWYVKINQFKVNWYVKVHQFNVNWYVKINQFKVNDMLKFINSLSIDMSKLNNSRAVRWSTGYLYCCSNLLKLICFANMINTALTTLLMGLIYLPTTRAPKQNKRVHNKISIFFGPRCWPSMEVRIFILICFSVSFWVLSKMAQKVKTFHVFNLIRGIASLLNAEGRKGSQSCVRINKPFLQKHPILRLILDTPIEF